MHRISRKLTGMFATCVLLALMVFCVLLAQPLNAQSGAMSKQKLQEKLESVKAAARENQQKLRQYTWTETSRVSVNGDEKPAKEYKCSYGPDGKVQKVQIGGPTGSADSGGGRLRRKIVEKKTAEMKEYMQQVGHVLALYMPPNPQKMQQAFQEQKVSMNTSGGLANLEFHDYALPADSVIISFDTAAKRIRSLDVNTYMNSPQEPVTLRVELSQLPDGTNYPLRTTLDAQTKKIRVVNTNLNYRKQ